jgi:hypothetical protein
LFNQPVPRLRVGKLGALEFQGRRGLTNFTPDSLTLRGLRDAEKFVSGQDRNEPEEHL